MSLVPRAVAVVVGVGVLSACTGQTPTAAPTSAGTSAAVSPTPRVGASTSISTAGPSAVPATLPDPRPEIGDLTVPDDLRLGSAVVDAAGTGPAPLPLGRLPATATHLTFAWVCDGGGQLELVDSAGQDRVVATCSSSNEATLGQSADVPGQSVRSRWRIEAGPATRWRVYVAAH